MALYLGNKRVRINLNGKIYTANIFFDSMGSLGILGKGILGAMILGKKN